jgi:hypothetical protein
LNADLETLKRFLCVPKVVGSILEVVLPKLEEAEESFERVAGELSFGEANKKSPGSS